MGEKKQDASCMNHRCNHPGFINWNNEEHQKWLKPRSVWWKASSQGLTLVSYCHRLPVDGKAAKEAKLSTPNNSLKKKKKNKRDICHQSLLQKDVNTSPAPFQKTLEILVAGDYRLKGWGTHESVEWFSRKVEDFLTLQAVTSYFALYFTSSFLRLGR